MGVYDTVMVRCPQCGTLAEFQSKSGSCKLETYALDEAPDDVLEDVNRHAPVTCAKCGARFGVEIVGPAPQRTLIARPKIWKDPDEAHSGEQSTMKVRVSSGKYTFVKGIETTTIQILRGGEPWHEQVSAFNAIASLMAELDAARVVLDAARLLGDDAPVEIKRALEKHRALVDDRELPSEWAAP